ncbi:unnamed protein product [Calypogeia fissa]
MSSKRRMVKKKEQLVLAGKGSKADYFDVYGEEAKAEAIWKVPKSSPPLKLEDFRELISWILADGMNPSWIFIKNKPLVAKVVLLFLPGLDYTLYTSQRRLLRNFKICCGKPNAVVAVSPTTTPNEVMEVLLTCPRRKRKQIENCNHRVVELPKTGDLHSTRSEAAVNGEGLDGYSSVDMSEDEQGRRRAKRAKQSSGGDRKKKSDNLLTDQCLGASQKVRTSDLQATSPVQYVLTVQQMQDHGYPMATVSSDGCSVQLPEGFVTTGVGSGSNHLDMVAVDCEMCTTAAGLELTRISLVDRDGKVLLDSLVKPANPITNYNTRYSGITSKMMEGVTTTLQQIQEKLVDIIPAETVIVGHSLECDLTALKLVHMKVIDTALQYQYSTSSSHFKPALRVLAQRYLRRKIQDSSEGHDSVEDARAAMDLAVLRMQKGPLGGKNTGTNRDNFLSVLSKHRRRCSILDSKSVLSQYAAGSCHAIVCNSDDDVLAKTVKEVKKPDVNFVWAQFTELNTYLSRRAQSQNEYSAYMAEVAALKTCRKGDGDQGEIVDVPVSADLEAVLKQLNGRIESLHEALPSNTMLMVLTGLGDTASVRRLKLELWKKQKNSSEASAQNYLECTDLLEELKTQAETALGFVTIKK